jgi:hypothetical protein
MGRIVWILCTAAILLCASAATAEDWKFFYEREEQKFYFDKAGLVRPDKTLVRVKEKATKKGGEEGAAEAEQARREYEINCKDRSFKVLSFTEFDPETGKEIATAQLPAKPGRRLGVYSNDRVAALYENLCP